jgi:hypothetical protein
MCIITHVGSALPYDRIDANHSSSKHVEEIPHTQPICDESSSSTSCAQLTFDSCLSYRTKLLPTKSDRSLQKHMSKELNKNTRKAHRHSFRNPFGEGVWMWRTKRLWIQFSRTGHQSKTSPWKSDSLTQSTTDRPLTSQHKQVYKRRANFAHELGARVEYAHQTVIPLLQWHCSKVTELAATS